MKIEIKSPEDLPSVAQSLMEYADAARIFLFEGDMGAGKTTFIKALCALLQVKDSVSSPTFSLVNEYEYPGGNIFHFDFYRMDTEEEAYDIGYEEYFYSGAYCFIEWPQKIKSLLPKQAIHVEISITGMNSRSFLFHKTN